MTYLALDLAVASRPRDWEVMPFARALARREDRRGASDADLMALRSIDGSIVPRSEVGDRQQPSPESLPRYLVVDDGLLVVNPMWLTGGAIGVSRTYGVVSPDYRVFAPTVEFESAYLHHLLRSQPYREQYQLLVRADTTFDRRIQQVDLDRMPVLVPPLEEQRRIAEFLDDQVTRIDNVIAARRVQMRSTAGRAAGSLAAISAERFGDETGPVPWFPGWGKGWTPKRISWIATCLDGRRVPLSATEREPMRGPYPYFGASAVVDYIDDYLFEGDHVLIGEDGASLENPEFDVVQEPSGRFWVNNHAHVLRATGVEPAYLAAVLRCVDRPLLVSGATRPKITQDDLMSLRVPVPPANIRAVLMDGVRQAKASVSVAIGALERSLELLQERRRSLITAAVTGELDITTASKRATGVSA